MLFYSPVKKSHDIDMKKIKIYLYEILMAGIHIKTVWL